MASLPLTYNVRSLFVRKATTIATACGIALVVFVLASVMMLVNGIDKAMTQSGVPGNVIVLNQGSDYELSGGIEETALNVIAALPQVKREGEMPLVAGEVVVVALLPKKSGGSSNVTLRGISAASAALRPGYRIVDGRAPKPGTVEAAVGRSVRNAFEGLDLGQRFELTNSRSVEIVGVFEDAGSMHESEVWIDRDYLATAYGRQGILSSIRARLDSEASYDAFKAQVEHDKRLGLSVWREATFLEHLASGVTPLVSILGGIISFFFAVGAMLGAMVTMYSAVANRTREIGTLRALGFTRPSILLSFLLESMLLAGLGGLIGAGASVLLKFASFSMMATGTWSELTFRFEPTPKVLVVALVFSLAMGLFGGFLPAVRASRISPAVAMRAR